MNFLKVEWTKKRGAIALLACGLAVSSFILGGYIATGSLNPWGNRHYYEVLNANFQECYTPAGSSTPQCQTTHNTLFNVGAQYVEKSTIDGTTGFCAVSATCSFQFIAMSGSAVTFAAADAVTGASNGNCAAAEGGSELTTNGFARNTAVITDISGNSGTATASSKDVITFTDNTAATTVQDSCLVNQSTASNANNVILAAASFTAITLQPGDTIQITWTIAWTWS
jgi:hypothetical protein